jgi:hypothetical protein
MAELDALKKDRIGGLMLRRDWSDRRPWPTADKGELTLMSRKSKRSSMLRASARN